MGTELEGAMGQGWDHADPTWADRDRPFPGHPADAHGLHRACVDYPDWIEVHNYSYSPRTVVGFGASLAVVVDWWSNGA